jgi:NADPH:quinone reductase-like Zn-dependent oxidoreductase
MVAMKAIEQRGYGGPDQLELRDVERPEPTDEQVLVRVHVAAANPLDWHFLTGTPWLLRLMAGLRTPKQPRRGVDLAGVVESVGSKVTRFRPGDEVFGGGNGTFAEYATSKETALAPLPPGMTMADAAAMPVAAVTALQGVRDHAKAGPGRSILINGAGGGVGNYAVQIAKALGADVTAVCGTHNVEIVRSLGADHVIDYTTTDFVAEAATTGRTYDAILDNVGNRSLGDCRRVLTDDGVLVVVSGPKKNRLLGPIARSIRAKVRFLFGGRNAVTFTASETAEELAALSRMVEEGRLRSVIDRTYPLADTADAIRYLADGHSEGKVLIDVIGEAG